MHDGAEPEITASSRTTITAIWKETDSIVHIALLCLEGKSGILEKCGSFSNGMSFPQHQLLYSKTHNHTSLKYYFLKFSPYYTKANFPLAFPYASAPFLLEHKNLTCNGSFLGVRQLYSIWRQKPHIIPALSVLAVPLGALSKTFCFSAVKQRS